MTRSFASAFSPRAVLAGSTLGPESDMVVGAALAVARAARGKLSLLYVLEPPPSAVPAGLLGFALVREGLVAAAQERLSAQLHRLGAGPEDVGELRVEVGPAGDALLAVAEKLSADLLVVGAAAADPLPLQRLGSTTRRLLRTAHQPVLVIKRPLRLPLHTVVAPLDLSQHASDSLRCGLALLDACGTETVGELVVLHAGAESAGTRAAVEAQVRSALPERRGVRVVTRTGRPTEVIRDYSRAEDVDLILMGTHGRSGWRRMTLGSVTEGLVRDATSSLLVVPPAVAREGALSGAVLEQAVSF